MNKPTSAAIAAATEFQAPATSTPMDMLDRAISSGASMEVLEKLMALQERWEANNGRRAFNEAIAEARASLPTVVKTSTADRGKGGTYSYETMADIAQAIDPVLGQRGLSYRFRTETKDGRIFVTCIISHRDGYSEETTLDAPRDDSGGKNAVQAIGSTVTYLQRYTLKAALGIAAAKDNDAKEVDRPTADPMTADQFRQLRARIDAQGEDAEKVEEYFLGKFNSETLHDLTAPQFTAAMVALAKREQAKGAA